MPPRRLEFCPSRGLILRLSLPFAAGRVTPPVMFLLAAAAIAASTPSAAPVVSVQATAMVRVISAVRVSFGEQQNDSNVPRPRLTVIMTGDAKPQPARLIEFE